MTPIRKAVRGIVLAASLVLASAAAAAAGPGYRLQVDGLACPFCAYGIEKRLLGVDGVAAVETHIAEGAVVVTMREGAVLGEAEARRAVAEAGFTLGGFERIGGAGEAAEE